MSEPTDAGIIQVRDVDPATLTVLTDDRDFLTVAAVTGQPVRLVTGTG